MTHRNYLVIRFPNGENVIFATRQDAQQTYREMGRGIKIGRRNTDGRDATKAELAYLKMMHNAIGLRLGLINTFNITR